MAMNLHDYFRTRCSNTLNAEVNIEMLFSTMARSVDNPMLKDMLQQHHDTVQCEVKNLEQIVTKLNGEKKTRRKVAAARDTEQVVVVGRGWIGTVGTETLEAHETFTTSVPKYLVDINAAMVEEEITHFNIGDYTGLIVLAKQLGEEEIANLLQQNIDLETQMRAQLESGKLAQIIVEDSNMEQKKAA